MTRWFAASLLLVVAMLCVAQVMLDERNASLQIRDHWRSSVHHVAIARLPRRHTVGMTESLDAPVAPDMAGPASFVEPHESLPPFLPPVFVPPRT